MDSNTSTANQAVLQSETILEVKEMSFSRGDKPIFNKISLLIPKGKITAVMGPSGTGKTTLLKLIGGQLSPNKGQIKLEGKDLATFDRSELFNARKRMGMLFQSGALFTDMTVFDNIAFPMRVHTDLSEAMIRDLVLLKLESVGLRGTYSMMPSELSGGMARRVALARAIALDPDIVMYDEPFAGQDPIAMGVLVNLIKQLSQVLKHTSIIVSHDIQETLSIADYIYVLSNGQVIASGTADELKQSTADDVKQFVQGLPDGPVPFHYKAPDLLQQLLSEAR